MPAGLTVPPACPSLTDQRTAASFEPLTVARKVTDPQASTADDDGPRVTATAGAG